MTRLELGLCTLEDIVKLGREHDVTPCFEFASHEGFLAVELSNRVVSGVEENYTGVMTHLAASKIHEDVVGENDCNVSLGGSFSLVHSSGLLGVNSPGGGLAVFGDLKFKDAVGLERGQGRVGNEEK